MTTPAGMIERHTDEHWRKTAAALGDVRDTFRPRTSDIPTNPGVYKWRDAEGRVIYVGKAKNLRQRLTSYFQPLHMLHPRTQNMVLSARSLEWTVVGTELEALTLEYTWIKEFDPRFNVVFRDDKTYPYLAVSLREPVPRVWITRYRNRKDTRYFGPYAKVWSLRQSLEMLLKAFPVRTCSSSVFRKAQLTQRPCLLASIGKCAAPCVGAISEADHRRMCEQLVGIMTGALGRQYVVQLTDEMKQASRKLEFERAAQLRDQVSALRTVLEQNAVVFDQHVEADIFGFATDELEASIHAFFVRGGSIRGERNWSVQRVEDISDAELMSDMITQVYARLMEEVHQPLNNAMLSANVIDAADSTSHTTSEQTHEDADTAPLNTSDASHLQAIAIIEKRNAVASTQQLTAASSTARAQASKRRHQRQQQTGRADLLVAPIAPIPSEILLPLAPARQHSLEAWLTRLRGSAVHIRVPERGEKRAIIERAQENAAQALQRSKLSRMSDIGARTQALQEIMKALGLAQAPLRIECYDISNTLGGAYQVASMVVCEDGVMKKSQYRRFSLHAADTTGAVGATDATDTANTAGDTASATSAAQAGLDDTAALYETLTRRFKHGNIAGDSGESIEALHAASQAPHAAAASTRHFAYKPNLLIVDGGQPQVEAAARALHDCHIEDVAVCGLAKKLEEVWVLGADYPLILKRQSEGMYLLQRIRDESHRFAIAYHRKQRRKGALHSLLDDIPGIGKAYQRKLLNKFGSVRALREATLEQLQAVSGIGNAKATAIYQALHASQSQASSS